MIKKYKPRFPILIQKKKVFIWYGDRWMNINLEIMVRGGGFKGFKSLVQGLFNCMFLKKHSFRRVFYVNTLEYVTECSYCHKRKNNR